MRARLLAVAFALALVIPAFHAGLLPVAAEDKPRPAPPPGGAPPDSHAQSNRPKRTPAEIAAMRDTVMNAMLKKIAGHENEPAESVFKDVRVLKGMPAGRFLRVMNMGFGASLGVGCGHCHKPGDWASEEKDEKQVARDMWKMMQTINGELLAKIPNLDEDNRTINCTTCHRGEVTPALTLPAH